MTNNFSPNPYSFSKIFLSIFFLSSYLYLVHFFLFVFIISLIDLFLLFIFSIVLLSSNTFIIIPIFSFGCLLLNVFNLDEVNIEIFGKKYLVDNYKKIIRLIIEKLNSDSSSLK